MANDTSINHDANIAHDAQTLWSAQTISSDVKDSQEFFQYEMDMASRDDDFYSLEDENGASFFVDAGFDDYHGTIDAGFLNDRFDGNGASLF